MSEPTTHLGEQISALLDGELGGAAAAAAQRHLDSCAVCRAEYDATAAVKAALRALPDVEPPPGFIEGLLTATGVATVTPITAAPARGGPRRRRPPVWAAGVAAAAALVALSLAPRHSRSVQPPVATFVDAHATAAPGAEPVSGLAPVAIPVSFRAP